jgi:hypothetical protein
LAQPKVIRQVPVDELAAVVRIKAQDGKGQRRLDFCNALLNPILPLVPNRPRLGPLRMHIG